MYFFTEVEIFFGGGYISVTESGIWFDVSKWVIHTLGDLWEYGRGLNMALNTWSFNMDLNYKSL